MISGIPQDDMHLEKHVDQTVQNRLEIIHGQSADRSAQSCATPPARDIADIG
jgi:hypothetical protein